MGRRTVFHHFELENHSRVVLHNRPSGGLMKPGVAPRGNLSDFKPGAPSSDFPATILGSKGHFFSINALFLAFNAFVNESKD